MLHGKGVRKYLVNRTIPSPANPTSGQQQYVVDKKIMLEAYDDLLRLKNELGMEVGTCRTVPMCLFPDLEKYRDFAPRGCAAGKKHMILEVGGKARACVSGSNLYGNIHEIGIAGCWEKMRKWRTHAIIPTECQDCHLLEECHAGCRMVAMHCDGFLAGCDNLRNGFDYRQEKGFRIARNRRKGAKVEFVDE
jgi:radical SAM protein with 4Fe4S-binding SPASM domain